MAIILKKYGLDLTVLASSIRINNKLVDVIENTSSLKHKTKIPIQQLPNQLLQQQETSRKHRKRNTINKVQETTFANDYNITADILEEFKTNRSSFENISN